jgi:hypothetical protein
MKVRSHAAFRDRHTGPCEKIARDLSRALPAGWVKAWAAAEMSERDGAIIIYYVDALQSVGWITPPLTVYEHFRALNDAARRADARHVWTTATFALQQTGAFDIDFGYDPIPIEDEDVRSDAWKARYLPQRS